METAVGGRKIGSRTPNLQTCISSVKEERHEVWAVIPHQQHLMPVRQSPEEQVFRQLAHLEFGGRFPSRKLCCVVTSGRVFQGSYVAPSTQFGTANS